MSCSSWLTSRSGIVREVEHGIAPRSGLLATERRGRHRHAPGSRHRPSPAPAPRSAALLDARQRRERAELRRHRDPVVGLGHHGRLAGDRIAQHREAVARADHERVEAVEIVQAALQRALRAYRPRACARRDRRPPPRCRCRSGSARPGARAARAGGCGSTASRCARGRCRRRSRTDASPRWSRRTRSPCACGRWRACRSAREDRGGR